MKPTHEDILAFIKRIRESFPNAVKVYSQGSCIQFALILKQAYSKGEVCWNEDHGAYFFNDHYYDITGEIENDDFIPLSEYDILQVDNILKLRYKIPKPKSTPIVWQILPLKDVQKPQPTAFKGLYGLTPDKVTFDLLKDEIGKFIDAMMKQEEYLQVNELQDTLDTCEDWFEERKKWFLDHVGKTVFQNNIDCDCPVCEKINNEGFTIVDESHAMDIFIKECIERSPNNPIIFTSKK